jgi:hypothetical protein
MRALAQFETFLETLLEGSFRRLFRGRLEPVDLARRLGRVMDDSKRITWDRPLVPNRYRMLLAPADYSDLETFAEALRHELEKYAVERAAEQGYAMLGPAEVLIEPDPALQPGSFRVEASVVGTSPAALEVGAAEREPPPDDDFGRTRAMRPVEMPVGPTGFEPLYLTGLCGGRRVSWSLSGTRITIGRGLDNDIVLEDASVSRHHAEITREGGRAEVHDLGSTNGTWVNAARVTVSLIHPGDQLAFGAVHLEVARRPHP